MKYQLAVFDLDGTILNTLEDLRDSVNYALAAEGFRDKMVLLQNGAENLVSSPEEILAKVKES